jgi:hypothetical protein
MFQLQRLHSIRRNTKITTPVVEDGADKVSFWYSLKLVETMMC